MSDHQNTNNKNTESLSYTRKFIIVAVLIILFVLILFKLNDFTKTEIISTEGQSYETAVVTDIVKDNLAEDGNRYGEQTVEVRLTSGSHKGEVIEGTSPSGQLFGATCTEGMRVIVILSTSSDTNVVTVYSQNRIFAIIGFLAVFVAVVILVGRRKGVMSILGLAFALVCIFYLMFPAIYRGASPILMSIIVSILTSLVTLGLLNGFTRKTVSAMIGTGVGVVCAGVAALLFGQAAGISGYNVSDIETLNYVAQNSAVQIGQLLFAGIIISSLGAVMDTGMSIASSIDEIYRVNHSLTPKDLYKSGIRVGSDMIGTMTNTLILAFVGGALTTLLINYAYDLSFNQLINSYNIGIEIMQGVAGSIGIVLSVPFTSLVSSILTPGKKVLEPEEEKAEEAQAEVSADREQAEVPADGTQAGMQTEAADENETPAETEAAAEIETPTETEAMDEIKAPMQTDPADINN